MEIGCFLSCEESGLSGELARVLPSPRHVGQAASPVTREQTPTAIVGGPDMERHAGSFTPYLERLDVDPHGPPSIPRDQQGIDEQVTEPGSNQQGSDRRAVDQRRPDRRDGEP